MQYDVLYKIIIIGDSNVGKSNILSRFVRDDFETKTTATIGVEFATRTLTLDDKIIKIQLWDTAGQERYRAVTSAYYRGATGVIMVYDLTQRVTFDHLQKWYQEVLDNTHEPVEVLLVGNKADLNHLREVSTQEAQTLARKQNFHFIETSAFTGSGVTDAFHLLISNLFLGTKKSIQGVSKETNLPSSQLMTETISIDSKHHPGNTRCKC